MFSRQKRLKPDLCKNKRHFYNMLFYIFRQTNYLHMKNLTSNQKEVERRRTG